MKKTLYLHIGHSKTGSSYLQSLFAINANALDAQGIHYPAVEGAARARAAEGKITSGNGRQLLQRMQAFVQRDHAPDDALLSDDRSMLFSSEALIGFLTCARGGQLHRRADARILGGARCRRPARPADTMGAGPRL